MKGFDDFCHNQLETENPVLIFFSKARKKRFCSKNTKKRKYEKSGIYENDSRIGAVKNPIKILCFGADDLSVFLLLLEANNGGENYGDSPEQV